MARSTATEIFRGFCTLRSSEDGAKRPDAQVSSFLELPIQGSVVGEAHGRIPWVTGRVLGMKFMGKAHPPAPAAPGREQASTGQ